MKSLSRSCLFVFLFSIFNIYGVQAQEQTKRVIKHTKIQIDEAKKMFALDDTETTHLNRALLARNKAYTEFKDNKSNSNSLKKKVDANFKKVALKTLTAKEFEKFSSWLLKNELKE